MRRFTDPAGAEWTVVLGRGSYGAMSLLFSRSGSIRVFSAPLETDTAASGRDLLTVLGDEDLRARLAAARPWDESAD